MSQVVPNLASCDRSLSPLLAEQSRSHIEAPSLKGSKLKNCWMPDPESRFFVKLLFLLGMSANR